MNMAINELPPDNTALKPVLITGGTKRMGLAIAQSLGQQGYPVILHARHNDAAAQAALDQLQSDGIAVSLVFADLADPLSLAAMISDLACTQTGLAGLVNNAGLFLEDDLVHFSPEIFARHMAVNVQAPILLIQGCRELLASAKGCVVNLLDHNIENPNIDFLSYKLTRFAMAGGVRILARALAPDIRVNAVAPGLTLPSPLQDEDEFAAIHNLVPLGRGSYPADIAQAVLYLLRARAVTGQILFVDGGERFLARRRDVSMEPPTH
jgi:NAD(P)-dependent dehydrogenase (short-subunit alcohol dehydrogenase family)